MRPSAEHTESKRGHIVVKQKIVLTMTSIPPRFSNLTRKFKAIEKQTVRPDFVELNIPETYRRFPGEVPALPNLPDWVSVKRCKKDYGPATKLLPAVERWRDTDADLLLCDDDRVPDRRWVERFVRTRQERPDDIIATRGWNISERFSIERDSLDLPRASLAPDRGRTKSYRWQRALSLGLYHPERRVYESAGYSDVFEGFLGALVPSKAIPKTAFDIPEVIWTVDDVWLSGMAFLNGTKVWVHDLPRQVHSNGRVDRLAALTDFVEQGHERESADRMAVDYLRREHNVWP